MPTWQEDDYPQPQYLNGTNSGNNSCQSLLHPITLFLDLYCLLVAANPPLYVLAFLFIIFNYFSEDQGEISIPLSKQASLHITRYFGISKIMAAKVYLL